MSDQVIWGIHMGREHGLAPVKDGYVAIGWHQVGDLSRIAPNREAFKSRIARHTLISNLERCQSQLGSSSDLHGK